MLQLAQDMYKRLQERVRTTLRVMVDLAESVGVPPSVTSLIPGMQREDYGASEQGGNDTGQEAYSWSQPPATVLAPQVEQRAHAEEQPPAPAPEKPRGSSRKRGLPGGDSAHRVRPLKVDDAIEGSTYLARIVWSLGVSSLEGNGPLRPADMARMIMSRSPVSLEPPNVARYIRRSKPTCIEIDHSEGNSHFYRLNDEGRSLFQEKFGLNGK